MQGNCVPWLRLWRVLAVEIPLEYKKYGLETICIQCHYLALAWVVSLHDEFEFDELPEDVQDELLARLKVLAEFGPQLGRPNVDTPEGSSFPNMKELRFRKDGLWRFAFAFDPQQQAIVLFGGDKEGENQKKFYRHLIKVADARFSTHLQGLRSALKKGK